MKKTTATILFLLLGSTAFGAPRRAAPNKAGADAAPIVRRDCDEPRGPGLTSEASPSGRAVGGFTDESKRLVGELPSAISKKQRLPDSWTFQCFVRDPYPLPDRPALVARFEGGPAAEPRDVAWQLWIERSGALCLGVEDAKGVRSVARHAGAPWRPGVWHHVAVVRELGARDAEGAREDRYRVWVVPLAPAASRAAPPAAPEPLIDHRLVTKAGPFRMADLVVGGGAAGKHPETAPGGALGGVVDEVSLWGRALSPAELAAARAAFLAGAGAAPAAAAAGPAETWLHWRFGESGKNPVAADASPAERGGRSAGRVGAAGRGVGGGAFEGFSTEESAVFSKPLPQHAFRKDWTLLAWVRNPRLSSKQACVLASADPDPRRRTVPWRLWFDSKGAPHVFAQDAAARRYAGEGAPVRFEPGKWHLVALTHRRGPGPQGGERDFFQVFVVPDGARGAPAPALDWSYGGGHLANGSQLQLGAAPAGRGKSAETCPAGWFGGQIAEALLLGGRALDAAAVGELARKRSLAD